MLASTRVKAGLSPGFHGCRFRGAPTSPRPLRFPHRPLISKTRARPLVWADYWILAVDADYRHALAGTPDRRSLWILARTPAMSIIEREGLIGLAREQGYDTGALINTEQGA